MFAIVQLPQGASQNRTSEVSREVERIMKADPAVWHVIGIVGMDFISGGAASNSPFIVPRHKPYVEREAPSLSAAAVIEPLRQKLAAIPGAPPVERRSVVVGRIV